MSLILTYYPNEGFSLNGKTLLWGTERRLTRNALNNTYQERDSTIDLTVDINTLHKNIITQRRDIYIDYDGSENYFFLNFDEEQLLKEIEVHNGLQISILNTALTFGMDFTEALNTLRTISDKSLKLDDGSSFFEYLKLVVANGESMGSDGNELEYFYCAKDITHLLDAAG